MKIKVFLTILSLYLISTSVLFAQKNENQGNGQPIIQIFGDFHTGLGENKEDLGFKLNRAYLGYQYELQKGLSVKAVMDIGESKDVTDYQRIAYIKNAQISWKHNNLTLNGGLISTTQFNEIEKFWAKRYIAKSFQDEYKFGHSADLGLSATYKFNNWLSADAIITNGEGYKKLQQGNGLQYGLGANLKPLKGLLVRLYAGVNERDDINLSFFTGYKHEKFSLGGEYNILKDRKQGISLYGDFLISKNIDFYARYDILEEENNIINEDKSCIISGFQFQFSNNIKISPNIKISIPKDKTLNPDYFAFISCYFAI